MLRVRLAPSALVLFACVLATSCDACDDDPPATYVFDDDSMIRGLSAPTSMSFTSTGGLFVAEKAGRVLYFQGLDDRTPAIVADLSAQVHDFYDRGLLSIRVHPSFPAEPSVYVLYAYDAPIGGAAPVFDDLDNREVSSVASGRLSRLELVSTESGDYALVAEHVLVHDWCQDFSSHSLGGLAFGADGMLYASAGDSASFIAADGPDTGQLGNLCGDPPGEGGSLRAQDVLSTDDPLGLDGSVIRIDPMTGEGALGNPYAGSEDPNARRIVAWGLRNPFRLATRPATQEVWIADVGLSSFEELNVLAPPFVGLNFGWPCYEGFDVQGRFEGTTFCEAFRDRVRDAELTITPPVFAYPNNEPVSDATPCGGDGASISGVAFNTGDRYPRAYAGGLFLADFARGCIWVLAAGEDGTPDTSRQLLATREAVSPVDLQAGPDGYLYFVSIYNGSIDRLTYGFPHDGGTPMETDPRAPLPTITEPAEDADVAPQTVVAFRGSATDADGVPLPISALSFDVRIFHCDEDAMDACHIHTLTALEGVDTGTFRMPADHEFPSYVEIRLRAEVVEDGTAHIGEATRRMRYPAP